MQDNRLAIGFAFLALAGTLSGCRLLENAGSTDFSVQTSASYTPPNCGSSCSSYSFPINATVYGNVDQPLSGTAVNTSGNGYYYGNTSSSILNSLDGLPEGSFLVGSPNTQDPIVDTNWSHNVWLNVNCATPAGGAYYLGTQAYLSNYEVDRVFMENGSNYPWVCNTSVLPPTNTSFSQFAIAGTVPSSIILPEIPGWGPFSAASGPPELQIFTGANGTPSLYYSTAASAVGTGGVSATFALPNSVPQGAYALVASNQNADGSYSTNAWDVLTVAGSQTIAGNPFGVAVGGYTDAFEDIGIQNDDGTCPGGTWGQNFYDTIPVVSLYSLGKVLVNGTAVTVGANPTAVTAFTGPDSEQDSSDDCNIYRNKYSGQTSAIVANSGGNTVSILDLVNDAVLNTVTVGRQPVALAVSSDGSKAYVANYADSTVTQVNLTTDTPITTIAVGGQPTSVALTAAGVLWVGGAGFLTEVNTSNMSVAATESTSGRTIAGLGFSDAENELIATSTVGTGSVSIDEISPSSVQNGGTYTALASHSVSTLGTYYNPRIQAQSFGFTSTLTSSSIPINTAQVGAPPLVVQDGWAVVTATPTGFSITDASGHIVLVSETTPSPVAAIAVDTNLNVAYLTEPDSNTLLTVPLPGTGGN